MYYSIESRYGRSSKMATIAVLVRMIAHANTIIKGEMYDKEKQNFMYGRDCIYCNFNWF